MLHKKFFEISGSSNFSVSTIDKLTKMYGVATDYSTFFENYSGLTYLK